MIRNKYITRFLGILVLTFSCLTESCSNFLEQEPGSQTSITEQLSTKNGVLIALNGVYSSLEANLRNDRFSTYADLQGGNLKFSPNVSGNNRGQFTAPLSLENVYNFQDQALSSDLESFYNESYDIINQANLILEYVDLLNDATTLEKNQIKAQAYTIRAYTHFLLTLIYAQNYGFTPDANHLGIVYNTTTLSDGIKYPSRETLKNTYALIINDITTALENYSDDLELSPKYSYFNSINTKALLARVYLYQNDWENAFETANDVVLNSGVPLVTKENYVSQWELTNTPVSEILLEFSIPRDSGGEVGGSLAFFFGYTSVTNYSKYIASEDLINLYETNDLRKSLFLTQPLPTLINENLVNANYYFTKKFQGNPGFVAIRLSEIYLIRAEASLKLNNLDAAKDDINVIRARANATLLETTTNLEEAILLERRKELCFEGHYFFDLARQQKSVSRTDGCISIVCNLNYPSTKYVLPIPQDNINLNANLQQNESY